MIIIKADILCLLCARYCPKYFSHINTCNSDNSSMRWVLLGRLYNVPKVP